MAPNDVESVNGGNLGIRVDAKKTIVYVKNPETNMLEEAVKIVKKKIYSPMFSEEELKFMLSGKPKLIWTLWEKGAPLPKMLGTVFNGRQVFCSMRLARKVGIIDETGKFIPPNMKYDGDSIKEKIFDPMDEVLPGAVGTGEAGNMTKAVLSSMAEELLSGIQHNTGKKEAVALVNYMIQEGVVKDRPVGSKKNTKSMIEEAIEVIKDYLEKPFDLTDYMPADEEDDDDAGLGDLVDDEE